MLALHFVIWKFATPIPRTPSGPGALTDARGAFPILGAPSQFSGRHPYSWSAFSIPGAPSRFQERFSGPQSASKN